MNMKNENYDVDENDSDKPLKAYKTEEPEIRTFNEIDLSGTYSYASYLRWKFEERVELIKGKIFRMSAPTTKHQICTGDIFVELHQFLKGKACRVFISPFDVRFPGSSLADQEVFTVLQPDVCVVCDDQKIDGKGCIGAPDIVVEVLSPGNNKKDLDFKFKVYEASGVREYWVLNPYTASILKYVLNEDGFFVAKESCFVSGVFTSDVLPGFSLNLEELFGIVDFSEC
jgi:Uma2 family endonuclease